MRSSVQIPGTLPRPKLHVLYLALAALVLITVGTSVYIGVRLLNTYTESVRVNAEWEDRSAKYRDLAALAGLVNAPGNELFESHNLHLEEARLDTAVANFEAGLDEASAELKKDVSGYRGVRETDGGSPDGSRQRCQQWSRRLGRCSASTERDGWTLRAGIWQKWTGSTRA